MGTLGRNGFNDLQLNTVNLRNNFIFAKVTYEICQFFFLNKISDLNHIHSKPQCDTKYCRGLYLRSYKTK